MRACAYLRVYDGASVRVCVYIAVHFVCLCAYVSVCMFACGWVRVCACVCVCTCACICICALVCAREHIYLYIVCMIVVACDVAYAMLGFVPTCTCIYGPATVHVCVRGTLYTR